jgi:hypothetical protein
MDVVRVGVLDALGYSCNELVVGCVLPVLKVVAAQPDDVGITVEPLAEEASVGARLVDAVCLEHGKPAAGFDRIEQNDHAAFGRDVDHVGGAVEVVRVRGRKIPRRGERRNAVEGRAVGVAGRVGVAQEVHPQRVDAVLRAVGDEIRGIVLAQIADHGLRRVADHQEGHVVLVDEITIVGAGLERKRRSRGRGPGPCHHRGHCCRNKRTGNAAHGPHGKSSRRIRRNDTTDGRHNKIVNPHSSQTRMI